MTAKVDEADVQDGYQFYECAFFFARTATGAPLKARGVASPGERHRLMAARTRREHLADFL
jgi:hypothetical protein